MTIRDGSGGLGRGLVAYDAEEAARIIGRSSREIEAILGYPGRAEMVHRDDMALGDRARPDQVLSDGRQRGSSVREASRARARRS